MRHMHQHVILYCLIFYHEFLKSTYCNTGFVWRFMHFDGCLCLINMFRSFPFKVAFTHSRGVMKAKQREGCCMTILMSALIVLSTLVISFVCSPGSAILYADAAQAFQNETSSTMLVSPYLNMVFWCVDGRCFKSDAHGLLNIDLPEPLHTISFADESNGKVYAEGEEGAGILFYKSEDRGKSFQTITESVFDADKATITGSGNLKEAIVFVRNDMDPEESSPSSSVQFFANGNDGWGATQKGLFVTSDSGTNWNLRAQFGCKCT
eukprot:Nk52_evm26s358 gene=Nk52_evmTU26s358